MNNPYLQEAINIGEQLIRAAERDKHGMSWRSAEIEPDNTITWKKTESIYNGVSGIALFFIALYKLTNNETYLLTAKEGMRWVRWYCNANPTDNYAFLSGRMGVAFTYLTLREVTDEKTYLHEALKIAKSSRDFLTASYTVNDFINGISGTLLGLLHLYTQTEKSWLLAIINDYIDALVSNATYGEEGIYWDSNSQEIHPLCGFSHGSSGIGFVFLELGKYFHNNAFYYLAEQAFAYENYYFDKQTNNWPDFRLSLYTEAEINYFETEYKQGNLHVFTQPGDMNAWCHGAAGIGLSRLRACELLHNTRYKIDSNRAIKKTLLTQHDSFTLCHGEGGNADLLLEGYLQRKQKKYNEYAKKVAEKILEQKNMLGKYVSGISGLSINEMEDPSLFLGSAGIGYFLLRVSNPEKVPSILAPVVSKKTNKLSSQSIMIVTLPQLKKKIMQNTFPRTMELLPTQISKDLEITSLEKVVKNLLPSLSIEQKHKITEIYKVESLKFQIENTSNNAYLYIQEHIQQNQARKLLELTEKNFLKLRLQLKPEVRIVILNNSPLLVKATSIGVKEKAINEFCAIVLDTFKKEILVSTAIKKIFTQYTIEDKMQGVVRKKIVEQIKEAITYGILS